MLGFVAHTIEALQAQGIIGPGAPWAIANAIWSMLHGLVMLTLDGQTSGTGLPHDALVEEATRIMMFGMARR